MVTVIGKQFKLPPNEFTAAGVRNFPGGVIWL
jgi:hypothetical protein